MPASSGIKGDAQFLPIAMPNGARPRRLPLALARFSPAFVRSLIFCRSSFASDASTAADQLVVSRQVRLGEAVKSDAMRA